MPSLFTSLQHLLIKPAYTIVSTLYTILIYITPARIQTRLSRTTSVYRQIINLLIGRALPDLTTFIPNVDLTGKNAIVTGSNSGIGLTIALELARRGANVALACRSLSRGETALQHILWNVPEAKGRVSVLKLDTSDLDSVKAFAVQWVESTASASRGAAGAKKLDILVHNAGISHAPPGKELTDDGIETLYATNFLGSFLLTYLLEPYLSGNARVVFTSSTGQLAGRFKDDFSLGPVRGVSEPGFHFPISKVPILGWERGSQGDSARYGMTKAMQCVLARILQRRWDQALSESQDKVQTQVTDPAVEDGEQFINRKRTAHSFTPDFTMTPIFGKFEATSGSWLNGLLRDPVFTLLKLGTVLATDVEQGAATGTWLACTRDLNVINGGGNHWDRMSRAFSVADAMSDEKLQRLWQRWQRDAGIEWT
ncbi:hypothetical protein H2200_003488 [Cladophialophora chaetospira]|uniref:NAD(P)-binding protein n=1 Tax=Cladophialophora chaetospira TaxID=386627 RepID=A0AA38XI55_9EURO|nr:hypothetical protein H2200_003488 [Cladophialophora chaetospira]